MRTFWKSEEGRIILKKAGINFLILACMAVAVVFLAESIWWNDISDLLDWMEKRTKVFFIDAGLVFVLEIFLYFIANSVFVSALTSGAGMLVLSIINHYKYTLKGDVFTLSDLRLAKEAIEVVSEFYISIPAIIILSVLLFAVCVILIGKNSRKTKFRIHPGVRIGLTVTGCVIMFVYLQKMPSFLVWAGANTDLERPDMYYAENGLIAGLVSTMPSELEEPQGYSEALVEDVIETYQKKTETATDVDKPNIIFIMNESLCDINRFEKLKLSEDPLAGLKSYQEQFIQGKLLSPSYGGNTCQVEYEVLTGYSAFNLSGIAYTDYVKEGVESIVSTLKANGYETYALHPNTRKFFNRENVYTYMGFDHMLFEGDFKKEITYTGSWASDRSLYANLIEEYENRPKNKPFFAHVVTTQNHGGHSWGYDDNGIYALSDTLEDKERTCLETYGNLLKDSDKALEELLTYFENTKEPAILVFWGDHAPELKQYGVQNIDKQEALAQYGLMEDGLKSEEESMKYYVDIHTTPLLIWNNYGLKSQDLGYISAYRVGAYALSLAGITTDSYFNMIAQEDWPNVVGGISVQGNTIEKEKDAADSIQKKWKAMWVMQYDRMFGMRYSLGGNRKEEEKNKNEILHVGQ